MLSVPRGRDRAIALEPRVVHLEHVVGRGIELIFGHARLGAAHGFHHPETRELGRAANHRNLARALDAAHLVEDRVQVAHVGARVARPQQLDEAALTRRRTVPEVVGARHLRRHQLAAALPEVLGRTELRVDRRRRGAASASPGACAGGRHERPVALRHRRHRLHVVHSGDPLDEIGVFGREDAALGGFEPCVAGRQIDRDGLRAAIEQQVGAGRFDAATGSRTCCAVAAA